MKMMNKSEFHEKSIHKSIMYKNTIEIHDFTNDKTFGKVHLYMHNAVLFTLFTTYKISRRSQTKKNNILF